MINRLENLQIIYSLSKIGRRIAIVFCPDEFRFIIDINSFSPVDTMGKKFSIKGKEISGTLEELKNVTLASPKSLDTAYNGKLDFLPLHSFDFSEVGNSYIIIG